jgi:hypothetical protein
MATRPDTHLLSQWNIGINTNCNGRRLIVVEEVEVNKTRLMYICVQGIIDYDGSDAVRR